jgi:nicotinamide-nucleotide amidase
LNRGAILNNVNTLPAPLLEAAAHLARCLQRYQVRVVFAESCTAGLVSAALATVPGISTWLCGSAVTYQDDTKARWLSVSESDLTQYTAVSPKVAQSMALGVLLATPQADLAVSITGHLGPFAPPEVDGVAFIGTAIRSPSPQSGGEPLHQREHGSPEKAPQLIQPERIVLKGGNRQERQVEAAILVLAWAVKRIEAEK